MIQEPLTQVLVMLLASVLVVAAARRIGLPPILGYLIVGLIVGPHALGFVGESHQTQLLAEIGVVFSCCSRSAWIFWRAWLPCAAKCSGWECSSVITTAVFALAGGCSSSCWSLSPRWCTVDDLPRSSSASSPNSRDQPHARQTRARDPAVQDLAFVPCWPGVGDRERQHRRRLHRRGMLRTLARACSHCPRADRRRGCCDLVHKFAQPADRAFHLSLFVVLASAWVTELAGLSLALGGFLAGMMLAETEFRHQVEAVIRPFRELLLGLFFISVGMLLDIRLLVDQFWLVSATVIGMVLLKVIIASAVVRGFVSTNFKALRTAIVIGGGGEFGIAIMTLLLQSSAVPATIIQPLLLALAVTMLMAPFGIRYNKTFARLMLQEKGPPQRAIEREEAATHEVARREHVILCGFGRVGQNIARVLESQGFEYIAVDLDLARVRPARAAGYPVIFGDSTDEDVLHACGVGTASAVVITLQSRCLVGSGVQFASSGGMSPCSCARPRPGLEG